MSNTEKKSPFTAEQRRSSKRMAWWLVGLAMAFYIGFAIVEYIR